MIDRQGGSEKSPGRSSTSQSPPPAAFTAPIELRKGHQESCRFQLSLARVLVVVTFWNFLFQDVDFD